MDGLETQRNEADGLAWMRKAADQGYAPAQRQLGAFYEQGRGVPADRAEASKWYALAADKGDEAARNALARMKAGDQSETDKGSKP